MLSKLSTQPDYNISSNHKVSRVRDYIRLFKPGVMSLVVFSGLAGLLVAPGQIHPFIAFIAILCIAIGSGASGAINMWYDQDIDRIMKRTQMRPIPQGLITPESALEFGVCTAFLSVFLMAIVVNYTAAILLLSAILFYVFIYTLWLKRVTPQNIVIGGAAGSFPPMIGWAAVTNNIAIESIILFTIIFMWTPPHFWALALYRSEDYQKAHVPMLPVTNGIKSTKIHIFTYSIIMLLTTLLPFFIHMSGLFYFGCALSSGVYFCILSFRLLRAKDILLAPKLFGYSIIYLFFIFTALIIDHYLINF
ncbi:heme o synthase [Rickettsiales endosymbiont of Stachyamoeba lipophora]|uniref:heme o synthase n=1 Tax=Rickettsiales endosymbiont of Stachyamoeba lipophora TaxID=2486578 RepID=UPI000F646BEF|nr:heme o synthase [Rickettsiales endosymbiont of Stachyamoeba lipophora]AZL15811.1 protoheme IX farnesyltransferase [Rickettsiales endosymbiont of Stachyamoeba lipophora]